MNESNDFLKSVVSNKKAVQQEQTHHVEQTKIQGAEQDNSKKNNIFDELVAEAKADSETRKVPLMSHVDPDLYDKVTLLCKKTGRSKSRVINDILRKAFG